MAPVPKRASQRRRRNRVDVDTVICDDEVRGPVLHGRHTAIGRRFYEALRRSGQAQFFEPSDWTVAELGVVAIDAFVAEPRASMLMAIERLSSSLLATEAARRRLRVELTHEDADVDVVQWADEARRRLRDEPA